MNSEAINRLVHIINPTANNSSNYVKQLPYKTPSASDRRIIEENVIEILSLDILKDIERIEHLHAQNNKLIEKAYS